MSRDLLLWQVRDLIWQLIWRRQWWAPNSYADHVAGWNCWCNPVAERQPRGGYLFLHRTTVQ